MTRLIAATLVLATALACNPPPPSDVAVSGPPITDAPEVLGATVDAHDVHRPAPTTTTIAPVVSAATTGSPEISQISREEPAAPAHTTPTTTPPPPVTAAPSSCGGWRDHIAVAFPGEVDYACRVFIGCESKGNPNAVSATGDHGLAQINEPTWNKPGHHDPVADWIGRHWHSVYDPATNLEMARRIRSAYGWQMWACA